MGVTQRWPWPGHVHRATAHVHALPVHMWVVYVPLQRTACAVILHSANQLKEQLKRSSAQQVHSHTDFLAPPLRLIS